MIPFHLPAASHHVSPRLTMSHHVLPSLITYYRFGQPLTTVYYFLNVLPQHTFDWQHVAVKPILSDTFRFSSSLTTSHCIFTTPYHFLPPVITSYFFLPLLITTDCGLPLLTRLTTSPHFALPHATSYNLVVIIAKSCYSLPLRSTSDMFCTSIPLLTTSYSIMRFLAASYHFLLPASPYCFCRLLLRFTSSRHFLTHLTRFFSTSHHFVSHYTTSCHFLPTLLDPSSFVFWLFLSTSYFYNTISTKFIVFQFLGPSYNI